MENPVVYDAMMSNGQDVLPLVLIDGDIAFRESYPSREELVGQIDIPAMS